MIFAFEMSTWPSVSQLSHKLNQKKVKIPWSVKGISSQTERNDLTIGQFPIHIGDTIVKVDTLTFTVIPIFCFQQRFEVVAVSQVDFLGAV